jgi:hypothetical protein
MNRIIGVALHALNRRARSLNKIPVSSSALSEKRSSYKPNSAPKIERRSGSCYRGLRRCGWNVKWLIGRRRLKHHNLFKGCGCCVRAGATLVSQGSPRREFPCAMLLCAMCRRHQSQVQLRFRTDSPHGTKE